MTRSVDDLAADVRRVFRFSKVADSPYALPETRAAEAALSELVALVGTLTQENKRLEDLAVYHAELHGQAARDARAQYVRAEAAEAENTRLREERDALATRLRDGAEHGETTEIRAWCLLALGES